MRASRATRARRAAADLEERRPGVQEREVLADARRADQEIVLRHESEPGLPGVARPAERHGRSIPQDLAGVRRQASRRDRDERGFARAVLAEEGVDFAGENDEICFGKSLGRAEALRDAPQLERRGEDEDEDL